MEQFREKYYDFDKQKLIQAQEAETRIGRRTGSEANEIGRSTESDRKMNGRGTKNNTLTK